MRGEVEDYVRSCLHCARNKAPRSKPRGLLQPLPTPARQWGSVSLDFVTDLPQSQGNTCIMVAVDRLTKMVHLMALPAVPTAEGAADVFMRSVVRLHGLPDDLISDRGTQFTSLLWNSLCRALNVKVKLSTAYHPQTDGQTERANQTMEVYLRSYVCSDQSDWARLAH
jgi:IS30 family transposase